MEIRIYDKEMTFRGIIENQTSFIWYRKYNEGGNFTLVVPVTPRNVQLLQAGNLVWVKGKVEAGVIEYLKFDLDHVQHALEVNGRFLETYMARRLIRPSSVLTTDAAINFEGTVEDAMRTFFSNAANIPRVELGERHGYTEEVSVQALYSNLLDYEIDLAKSAAFGFRFRPDFDQKKITFEIYKGVDHTKSQSDHTRVIFSEEYSNIVSIEYTYNDQVSANVCYVGGEGQEDGDPWKLYVVVGDTEASGLDRRELYIDGQTQSNGLSIATYRAKLEDEGRIALESTQPAEAVNCVINPFGNFVYGQHYDVGDIVTVEKADWGVSMDLRITGITEIYEAEIPKIEVTLGTPLAEKITWR